MYSLVTTEVGRGKGRDIVSIVGELVIVRIWEHLDDVIGISQVGSMLIVKGNILNKNWFRVGGRFYFMAGGVGYVGRRG